ncbi:hypothetical protein LOZ66_001269 [Ophidiomyces ophidiicola]|nr:hypothetical protein LOZ66_001269 [Ophidiomyces ophidiicola]
MASKKKGNKKNQKKHKQQDGEEQPELPQGLEQEQEQEQSQDAEDNLEQLPTPPPEKATAAQLSSLPLSPKTDAHTSPTIEAPFAESAEATPPATPTEFIEETSVTATEPNINPETILNTIPDTEAGTVPESITDIAAEAVPIATPEPILDTILENKPIALPKPAVNIVPGIAPDSLPIPAFNNIPKTILDAPQLNRSSLANEESTIVTEELPKELEIEQDKELEKEPEIESKHLESVLSPESERETEKVTEAPGLQDTVSETPIPNAKETPATSISEPASDTDVSHTAYKSSPVPTPTEIAPKSQRQQSVAEPRFPSPSLPSAKPKTSSPQAYGYPQSASPVHAHSPHYAYSIPYPHPYAPTPIYPNGSLHDPNQAAMAVSVGTHYSPVVHSSNTDRYHSRMASRGSFGRNHPDYPYNMSSHPPKRVSTPTQQRQAENGNSDSLHIEGDTIKLLQRIQNVIPDINRLVTSYRDTQNQLSAHVAQSRQIEEQHERSLMEKEFYIEALQAQIQKAAKENAAEAAKLRNRISELRMELGGLQEQHRDVEDSLEELKKANDELIQARADLEEEISGLQKTMQEEKFNHREEMQRQQELTKDALTAQKEELNGYFQEIKNEDDRLAAEQLQAREQELNEERDNLKANWERQMKELEQSKVDMAADYDNKLKVKQDEIDAKEADLVAKQGELDAKQTELESKQEELNAAKLDLDAKQLELEKRQQELEEKQKEIDAKQEEINGLKSDLESKIADLEAKQRELDEKQAELQAKQSELQSIQEQLEGVKADLEEKKQELEAKEAELVSKQEALDAKQTELDDVREKYAAEVAALQAALEEQKNATKASEDKVAEMTTERQQKEESWQKDREDFEAQLKHKAEELKLVLEEKEVLSLDGKTREEQLQNIVEEMRQTHDNLSKDRERLKKTLHSLGEATDMKIKGDAFFIDCFGDLSRLIVELSKEFFTYIPIEPPAHILAKIPSDIPQFLDNTPASRELRSAYVQHVVSKTLTYRIFQPFLFTLGRRYDKADTFFQMLSIDIRRKSVRREAFWRQQTLKAAYTASDAKQAINVVAAVVVDEIVDHILHFTDPKHLDALVISVRKIVKLAAETWRLARVERELIVATMPSADDNQTANDQWDEFIYDASSSSPKPSESGRTPLLRMLPRIHREPVHEDFLKPEEAEKANQCVYVPGVILYTDSPPVLARKEELSKKSTDVPPLGVESTETTNGAEIHGENLTEKAEA